MPEQLPKYLPLIPLCIGVVCIFIITMLFPPKGDDWLIFFKPATLALLGGQSPFTVDGYYTPPWLLVFLLPFSLLPEKLGVSFLFLTALGVYIFVGLKSGANPLTLLLFIFSPPVIYDLLLLNINWLVLLT
jgi:hypothetical protein